MPGGCSGGDISEWEIPCPELMRLSCPGRIGWSLPRLSRCTISPSTSQVTVCRPVCGCGATCMPGRPLTSSGPKWSTKHHAPTIRRCRCGSNRRTVGYRPSGTSCPGSSPLCGSGAVATVPPYSWSSIKTTPLPIDLPRVTWCRGASPTWWTATPPTTPDGSARLQPCPSPLEPRRACRLAPPPDGLRLPSLASSVLGQPGIPGGVVAGVVGVQVDEAALDEEVPDLEDVAPPARAPLGHAGPPRAILVLTVTGALDDDQVRAGEEPGELAVVVLDRLQRASDIGEQSADVLLAGGQAPLGEHDLGVVGEQVQDASAGGGRAGVVEGLEVLEG